MDECRWIETGATEPQQLALRDPGSKTSYPHMIMKAACFDDCVVLEYLLPSLQPADCPLIQSAMCRAASRGHIRAFRTLAKYCHDIHADDSRRATNSIISSMMGGNYEILDIILSHGGDIDRATRSGRTALITAVSLGRWDLLQPIISRGANVNKPTIDGRTPLCLATSLGRLDLVELLLRYGASVNCGCHCNTPGQLGNFHCAIDVAALKGHTELVSLFLSHRAFFFRESELFLPVLDSLLHRGDDHVAIALMATVPDLNAIIENQPVTPLCLAVQRGCFVVVRFLVLQGANLHVSSRDGPALCYAVVNNYPGIANWLIDKGAEVNAHSETYGSALHAAVEFGYVNMVELLLRKGGDVHTDSPKGCPIQVARNEWRDSCTSERQRRYEGIIELLESAGASDEHSRARSPVVYEAIAICDFGEEYEYSGTKLYKWFDGG